MATGAEERDEGGLQAGTIQTKDSVFGEGRFVVSQSDLGGAASGLELDSSGVIFKKFLLGYN